MGIILIPGIRPVVVQLLDLSPHLSTRVYQKLQVLREFCVMSLPILTEVVVQPNVELFPLVEIVEIIPSQKPVAAFLLGAIAIFLTGVVQRRRVLNRRNTYLSRFNCKAKYDNSLIINTVA